MTAKLKIQSSKIKSITAAFALLLLAGCASAHKKAETIHEIREFNPATGKLVKQEIWCDRYHGGGVALLADPRASEIQSAHTNQTALGGGSAFAVGQVESTVNTNAVKAIGETIGNVVEKAIEGAKH